MRRASRQGERVDQVGRRAFVAGAAGIAVAGAGAGTVWARPGGVPGESVPRFSRAVGVAVVGATPRVLCQAGGEWVLATTGGAVTATRGLGGATVVDVHASPNGATAVGSQSVGDGTEGTVWRSADGVTWQEVYRLHGVNSEFTAVGGALVLGSLLTRERAPRGVIAAVERAGAWASVPVRGLESVADLSVTSLGAVGSHWVVAAVGANGAQLFRSSDGAGWAALSRGRFADTVVHGMVARSDGSVGWMANTLGGSAAITGGVGGARRRVPVRQDAQAVGVAGSTSYWLVDGRLTAVGI